jgi:DNA-binding CsgD family transcriptional regulator
MQPEQPMHYRAAERGTMPAEALTERDRTRLLWALYGRGMTPAQIAAHTRTTLYTVERILLNRGHARRAA